VQDTDLGGAQVAGTGATVLSVSGIRRLRDLVRGRAAAPTGECPALAADALPGRDRRSGAEGEAHVGSPPGTAANESRR
jgi:hypothetical protein